MNSPFSLHRDWSNYAKLFAALLVAVSHYSTVIVVNNHWSDSQFLRLWCQGGYIGVAIFFFFSGFGLMESDQREHLSLKLFIKKRFAKVYLPVLLVSAIWTPIYNLWVANPTTEVNLWGTVYDILWNFHDPVLWFVKILFLLYFVFFTATELHEREFHVIGHLLMISGIVFATWLANHNGYPYISVPLFGIGVYTSVLKQQYVLRIPACYYLIGAMTFVCAICFVLTREADPAHGVLNCVILAITLLIIRVLQTITPPILLSAFTISATYTIYIVHFKVLDLMVANWGHISYWSWAATTMVVTIVITYIRNLLKI